MDCILRNASVYRPGGFEQLDLLIRGGIIERMASAIPAEDGLAELDLQGHVIVPGLVDVHVHFREPGFLQKENIATGSAAAAHGGYTTVCTMPNLNPTPDTLEHLEVQLKAIRETAKIHVVPYGTITMKEQGVELADMEAMAPYVAGFSDDGRGVQSDDMMNAAMLKAKELGKMIVAHCEVNDLLRGGYIHDGEYAKAHGHRGICSESEYAQIARDLELVREIGCAYHVCHISTKESVELIRNAKAEGLDVTCETGPHYLVLDDGDLREDGRFKMNPPLRSPADREALIEGVLDGTIDMIATDHAPHSAEEKGRGLEKSAFGIVGLETAFPVLYTYMVQAGVLSMDKLVEVMCINPRKRFGIPMGFDFSVWDVGEAYTVDPETFVTMGRATPFTGHTLRGKCLLTVVDGKVVYKA